MTQALAQTADALDDAAASGVADEKSAPVGANGVSEAPVGTKSVAPVEDSSGREVPGTDPVEQAIDALAEAATLFEAGGPVVAILAVMSVFALAIILAKKLHFSRAGTGDRRSVREALKLVRGGRPRDAHVAASSGRNPASGILALALENQARGIDEGRIREACYCEAQLRIEALRGWMRPLEVIASLAPLLGLFGTVLGMIEAFSQLEAAGSQVDPAILSGGIWEALLTTAVGLAVAIPVVAAVNWFERRIERVEHEIDTALAGLFGASWQPAPDLTARAATSETERSYDLDITDMRPAAAGE